MISDRLRELANYAAAQQAQEQDPTSEELKTGRSEASDQFMTQLDREGIGYFDREDADRIAAGIVAGSFDVLYHECGRAIILDDDTFRIHGGDLAGHAIEICPECGKRLDAFDLYPVSGGTLHNMLRQAGLYPTADSLVLMADSEQRTIGTPPQRGTILEERAALLRLELQIADNLRQKLLAPDVPLELPLERTPEREQIVVNSLERLTNGSNFRIPPKITKDQFYSDIINEVFGYGPIQPLVDRDDINEIMVNGPYIVFVERQGRMVESGYKFLDDDHVERIVKRIVLPLGRVVGSEHPLIDARLPDGPRVNAVIRPCAIDGPSITIRKFSREKLQVPDLTRFGTLTEDVAAFLEAAVVSRRNIVVSGGTGSGKTTLINILSGYIPEHERTVTIEDAAELQLRQRNVVRLETKKPSPENPTEVTIRDCVVNALRMRPERIVVGECRSGEALDMLQAMNTGHDGSMTTIHANSPRDCLSRLETLVLMAGLDLPLETVRRQLASAIHMIVQIARLRDGSRKVTHVTEILGMEGKNIVMQDVFLFYDEGDTEDSKVKGYHSSTGLRPKCSEAFKRYGFQLPSSMFMKPSRPE